MTENIKNAFTESIQTKIEAADTLPETIERAGNLLVNSLVEGGKVMVCGNGTSAALAQHFSSKMLNRFERERPSLPSIALTSDNISFSEIAADCGLAQVYAKQVNALGNAGDILVVISPEGNEPNIISAIEAALNRDLLIVALSGKDGGSIAGLVSSNDVEVRVPSNNTSRIHEVHMLIIHTLCDYIDSSLFGELN